MKRSATVFFVIILSCLLILPAYARGSESPEAEETDKYKLIYAAIEYLDRNPDHFKDWKTVDFETDKYAITGNVVQKESKDFYLDVAITNKGNGKKILIHSNPFIIDLGFLGKTADLELYGDDTVELDGKTYYLKDLDTGTQKKIEEIYSMTIDIMLEKYIPMIENFEKKNQEKFDEAL